MSDYVTVEAGSLTSFNSLFTSSQTGFSDVVFVGVAETYATESILECRFKLRPSLGPPGAADFVGLYRIGWTSPQDFKCCRPVVCSADCCTGGENKTLTVAFDVKELPSDDGEFYQFCYLSAPSDASSERGVQVLGASTPFQFSDDDFEIVDQPASLMTPDVEVTDPEKDAIIDVIQNVKEVVVHQDVIDVTDADNDVIVVSQPSQISDLLTVDDDRQKQSAPCTSDSLRQTGVPSVGVNELLIELASLKESHEQCLSALKESQASEKALRCERDELRNNLVEVSSQRDEQTGRLKTSLSEKILEISELSLKLEALQTESLKLQESMAGLSVLPGQLEAVRAENVELRKKVADYASLEGAMHAQDVARQKMNEIICKKDNENERLNAELKLMRDELAKLSIQTSDGGRSTRQQTPNTSATPAPRMKFSNPYENSSNGKKGHGFMDHFNSEMKF